MNCALENYIDDDLQLRLENPTKYYLDHIDNEIIMLELARDDIDLYIYVTRLDFIRKMSNHEKMYQCPECHSNIITNEWGEEFCETCGLVTRTHYNYTAGQKIRLPFGLK